jgi:hypothetical protein
MAEQQSPQVITLNLRNSVEILAQYIEVAQKAGTFLLPESDVLKRAKDVLLNDAQDHEINVLSARNLFIQAVNKGQSKGAYTLDDASLIHKICQFISQNIEAPPPSIPVSNIEPSSSTQENVSVENETESVDLDSLSDPVPLRAGPRTV